jgi:hypothetical protein
MKSKTHSQATSYTALRRHLTGRAATNDKDIIYLAGKVGNLVRGGMEVDFGAGDRHAKCEARYGRIERREREDR